MNAPESPKRLVIGISGASGAVLAVQLLKEMQQFPDWETHLVISEGASRTIQYETPYKMEDLAALAARYYSLDDIGASIASGTFNTQGMVIVPCSMNTVASIASGICDNLLLRAADVTLKERRRLVLVPRECPLSATHLRNLQNVCSVGAIVLPAMLTFYSKPSSIEEMVRHIIGKILDIFDLELSGFNRWQGMTD